MPPEQIAIRKAAGCRTESATYCALHGGQGETIRQPRGRQGLLFWQGNSMMITRDCQNDGPIGPRTWQRVGEPKQMTVAGAKIGLATGPAFVAIRPFFVMCPAIARIVRRDPLSTAASSPPPRTPPRSGAHRVLTCSSRHEIDSFRVAWASCPCCLARVHGQDARATPARARRHRPSEGASCRNTTSE